MHRTPDRGERTCRGALHPRSRFTSRRRRGSSRAAGQRPAPKAGSSRVAGQRPARGGFPAVRAAENQPESHGSGQPCVHLPFGDVSLEREPPHPHGYLRPAHPAARLRHVHLPDGVSDLLRGRVSPACRRFFRERREYRRARPEIRIRRAGLVCLICRACGPRRIRARTPRPRPPAERVGRAAPFPFACVQCRASFLSVFYLCERDRRTPRGSAERHDSCLFTNTASSNVTISYHALKKMSIVMTKHFSKPLDCHEK